MNQQIMELAIGEMRKKMGKDVKDRREFLQMSAEELADKAGLAKYTVIRFEEGKFWIGMKQYLQIMHVLGMSGITVSWNNQ